MNESRNNPTMMSRWAVFALMAAAIANGSAAQLSSREMKAVERLAPVENTGRFLYFDHRFETNSPLVFVCELDVSRSGGSFLPLRFEEGAPVVCGDGVDGCYPFEWYRIQRTDGSVVLAVLSAKGFGDGDDLRGFLQPRSVSVFALDGTTVCRTSLPGSFMELLLDPKFAAIEPVVDWHRAQRRDDGLWIDEKSRSPRQAFLDAEPPHFDNSNGMPMESDRSRLVALRKALFDHFDSKIPETIKFVFDRGPKKDIVRAFIADLTNPLPDGSFLWESFQWTERGWEPVSQEGADCPSGRIPNAFPLSPSGFFVLLHQNEEPRLVTMRRTPNGPVEPFWEKALSDQNLVERTRPLGIPDRDSPPDAWSGVHMPPRSIAQALYDSGRIRRLFRQQVVGLDIVGPLWKSNP